MIEQGKVVLTAINTLPLCELPSLRKIEHFFGRFSNSEIELVNKCQ